MRTSFGNFLLGIILGVCLLLLETTTARSQSIGTGLVCDTYEQVTLFVENFNGSTQAALALINERYGSGACGVIATTYYRGDKKGEVRNRQGTYDITEIIVVGHHVGNGLFMPLRPAIQYTIFAQDGRAI